MTYINILLRKRETGRETEIERQRQREKERLAGTYIDRQGGRDGETEN